MANQWEVANEWEVAEPTATSQWEPVQTEAPIMAPAVEVTPTSKPNVLEIPKAEKPTYTGVLSLADIALSTPGYITQTVGSLGNLAIQALTPGVKVDPTKARQFGEGLAQKLSLLPEQGELMPGEFIAKKFGDQKEYQRSLPYQAMGKISDAISATAQSAEDSGVMSKDAALIAIDSALVFAPMMRRTRRTPEISKEVATVASPERAYSEAGVEVPKPSVDPVKFADSLYNIDTLYKADLSEAVVQDKILKSMEIPSEMKEKFRRLDEGQAKGNELINNEISTAQAEVNSIYKNNFDLFKEYDYRSKVNPEGTLTDFAKLPEEVKSTISANYERIKSLRDGIEEIASRRGSTEQLLPHEASIYSHFYSPLRQEIRELSQHLMDRGRAEPRVITDEFASRKQAPAANKSLWETYKEAIVGKDYAEQAPGNIFVSDAAKERAFFTLESPVTKKRTTISLSEPNKQGLVTVNEHVNKKITRSFKVPEDMVNKSLQEGTGFLGRTLKEASVDEINLNIGPKYATNYNLVQGNRIAELRDQIRKADWVDDLMNSPEFSDIAIKVSDLPKYKELPEGFRELQYTSKMPELRDYAFENRYAEILDDYNKPAETNPLITASNTLITNMMLWPFIHMHNEAGHWALSRGVSGFVNPSRLKQTLPGLQKAYLEVKNRGPIYQQLLREGGSIMSANVRNSSYIENAFKQSADTMVKDSKFKEIAKLVGRTPADLYKGLSKFSNKAMWSVRDVLYTQLIMEKMSREGLSMQEAIKAVERHMPPYRLPSRIGETLPTKGIMDSVSKVLNAQGTKKILGKKVTASLIEAIDKGLGQKLLGAKLSRGVSKGLQNRNLFIFARYHHGMLSSALNTLKDIATVNPGVKKLDQFKEGIDSALAAYVAMSLIYPTLDQVAEFVAEALDSEGKIAEAKVRRPGVLHVFDTVREVAEGKKDAYALSSILVTLNPILQTAIELAWNAELYNRKEIANFKDLPENLVKDYSSYILRKIPQAGQAIQATNEDYGTGLAGVLLRNFFDIKARTADQIDREEKQVERKEKEAWNKQFEF